jgi:GR25 family glycosyltransferase involved in LPS biosynthesis
MKPLYVALIVAAILLTIIVVIGCVLSCKPSVRETIEKNECLELKLSRFIPKQPKSPLGDDIPIYYINLDRSVERRKHFEKQVKRYSIQNPIRRIEAVDGKRDLSSVHHGQLKDFSFENRLGKVSWGEAGCTLSHLRTFLRIFRDGHDKALIFEDDVSFCLLPFWPESLESLISKLPPDNHVVHMASPHANKNQTFKMLTSKDWVTLAYLVSRKAIQKLLSELCPNFHLQKLPHFVFQRVKNPVFKRQAFIADVGLYPRFHPLVLTKFPAFTTQNDLGALNSTIHQDHTPVHLEWKRKALEFYVEPLKESIPKPCLNDSLHVLYINLDHRKDRRQSILDNFGNFPIRLERVSAVKNNRHGAIGCGRSHVKALRLAKERSWDHVLILEDDAIWKGNTSWHHLMKTLNFIDHHEEWDVIVLGATVKESKPKSPKYMKITSATSTYAYLVRYHYFDQLIDNFTRGTNQLEKSDLSTASYEKYAIDQTWQQLQQKHNWFGVWPLVIGHSLTYSDIDKKISPHTGS